MNKEQFRKELEDCWNTSAKYSLHFINTDDILPPGPMTYITTRLAAIDDGQEGKGLGWNDVYIVKAGKLLTTWDGETVDLWVTGIREEQIPLWGNESNKPAGIYLTKPKGDSIHCLSFITPKINSAIQVIVPTPALPVADGEGEKVGVMIEYLDGLPISSGEGFNMLKAIKQKLHETTLPSAVTGGVKEDDVAKLIARLAELKKYHMVPYNLGDTGEMGQIIDKLEKLISD